MDSVENELHKAVCDHRVQLPDGQTAIATDWTTAMTRLHLPATTG
ncbi:hypothetical protein ODJ79_44695 [Actinoplanes sp. KI2]|nr:hypothetical protein [Actinoplanes sp. KI2]MCU7730857.1 hypothetical protein [Actinoplanes sp. KI2]